MHVDEKEATPAGTPTEPVNEPLKTLANAQSEPLSIDEADEIFFHAVSEIPTQPLAKLREQKIAARHFTLVVFLFVFSLLAGSIIAILMYPTVTIELVPISKHAVFTTQLSIPTRTFAPVTLSKSLSAPTTGHGHQNATRAVGIVTFYNGLFTTQTLPIGTVFTGSDGVKVSIDETVTLPAGNPPTYGEATITAQALTPGAAGNIQAGNINTTVSNGVLVKNLEAFTGGQNARDYQAVAQSDVDSLNATLQQQLTQALPHLFFLRSGEALQTTNCTFKATPNHQPGAEAIEVTVKSTRTCQGIAYNKDKLERTATAAFNATRPGTNYQLVGSVQTSIVNLFPFIAQVSGTWVYLLSQDYEQFLAEKIAGDTPEQAKKYLLQTGFITRATVPAPLPKDPGHITFQILIGV